MKMNDINSKSRLNRRKYILFSVLMIVITLTACKGTNAITPISQSQQAQGNPVITATNTLLPSTETPFPTSTLVPTLTPSPTPIPEQLLSEIIASVSDVVHFNPVEEAMVYDGQKPGPHHIVLITELGESDEGNDKIPSEWLPKNVSEVELIAIIIPEEVVTRTMNHKDSHPPYKTLCIRIDIRVKLIEAISGKVIDKTIFPGYSPSDCYPYTKRDYGGPPSFDVVIQWLQGYVFP